jgi:hypothetical protein
MKYSVKLIASLSKLSVPLSESAVNIPLLLNHSIARNCFAVKLSPFHRAPHAARRYLQRLCFFLMEAIKPLEKPYERLSISFIVVARLQLKVRARL